MHLYVHVPFCARRCSYCDFAIAVRRDTPSQEFVQAIEREWAGWQAHPAWAHAPLLDTIYFGGGTPSRLDPAAIAALITRFLRDRTLAPDAEITLEANPDDVDASRADAWRGAGVNRISLGAQSLEADVLSWMHRTHDAGQVGAAVATLRAAGFGNISLDLIYAVPAALERDWPADLDRALELGPDHLSLYGLTVEAHTPLGKWTARGESLPAADDRAAEEYLLAHQRITSAGFEHYEVSNAARPGSRARHNAAYWRRAPCIGLGPSAHSGFGAERAWNVRDWEEYRRRGEAGLPVRAESETLTEAQIRLEEAYLGLRTSDGLAASRLPESTASLWIGAGWAKSLQGRVVLTPEGWLRLDALVATLSHC
ncbi:MAG TPA: radical SAM family heme chaperone HemW [Gemmatimonadales bacterium]|nr:radical SAM family heme chaperone HemW [Gemmatimonadales bacterium]